MKVAKLILLTVIHVKNNIFILNLKINVLKNVKMVGLQLKIRKNVNNVKIMKIANNMNQMHVIVLNVNQVL